jgi:hypothetical protein
MKKVLLLLALLALGDSVPRPPVSWLSAPAVFA